MKPVDFRNTTFETIREQLSGRLAEVYAAWVRLGPATTRILANNSGIDILNVRPRTTDLVGVGLVELVGGEHGEGIYKARSQADWETWLRQHQFPIASQLNLI
jgi:hypothetical protein